MRQRSQTVHIHKLSISASTASPTLEKTAQDGGKRGRTAFSNDLQANKLIHAEFK
jgi:hypothetical protein